MSESKQHLCKISAATTQVTHETRIPGESDWSGYEPDLDVRFSHGLFHEKSIEDVLRLSRETQVTIERTPERSTRRLTAAWSERGLARVLLSMYEQRVAHAES